MYEFELEDERRRYATYDNDFSSERNVVEDHIM